MGEYSTASYCLKLGQLSTADRSLSDEGWDEHWSICTNIYYWEPLWYCLFSKIKVVDSLRGSTNCLVEGFSFFFLFVQAGYYRVHGWVILMTIFLLGTMHITSHQGYIFQMVPAWFLHVQWLKCDVMSSSMGFYHQVLNGKWDGQQQTVRSWGLLDIIDQGHHKR